MRLILLLALLAAPPPAAAVDDPLDELIVEASRRSLPALRLPKVAVVTAADDPAARGLAAILRRDLELSFEVDVVDVVDVVDGLEPRRESAASEPCAPSLEATGAAGEGPACEGRRGAAVDPAAPPSAAELDAWRRAGAELVVLARVETIADGDATFEARLIDLGEGGVPLFKRRQGAAPGEERRAAHRLSDALLGALTGYSGPFLSQLALVRTREGARRVLTLDADGHGLRARSPAEHLALSPAYGPDNALYWAASVDRGSYRLYREGEASPLRVPIPGSIYGVAFSDDRSTIALSIADGDGLRIYTGDADLRALEPRSKVPMALHPAFTPRGEVAYAGAVGSRQRIYLGPRPVSPRELTATAPVICRHPDGPRLVYSVTAGERQALLVTDERGREPLPLRSRARRSFPACSPDGRLVAFFSSGEGTAGPGLYLIRVDGRRPPKKIASVTGDSLRWARIP